MSAELQNRHSPSGRHDLADRLQDAGLHVDRQVQVPIVFEGKTFVEAFRADLIIENRVIIELSGVA